MREILFRGKRLNGDGWAYGDLSYHVHDGEVYVFPGDGYDSPDCYEVYPGTVGQYTGLTDKNGVKIFEGDILRCLVPVYKIGQAAPVGDRWLIGVVIWNDTYSREPGSWELDAHDEHGNPTKYIFSSRFEIIGNIHDNPELLEGGAT